jgi:hypothetical protein
MILLMANHQMLITFLEAHKNWLELSVLFPKSCEDVRICFSHSLIIRFRNLIRNACFLIQGYVPIEKIPHILT